MGRSLELEQEIGVQKAREMHGLPWKSVQRGEGLAGGWPDGEGLLGMSFPPADRRETCLSYLRLVTGGGGGGLLASGALHSLPKKSGQVFLTGPNFLIQFFLLSLSDFQPILLFRGLDTASKAKKVLL